METTRPRSALIIGASGGTGRHVVRCAREAGLSVRALTSVAEKERALRAMGVDDVVVGDLRDRDVRARIVLGMDIVLSAVGGADVFIRGVTPLIAAAKDAGVRSLVMEASLGCGDSRDAIPMRVYEMLRSPIEAMNVAEEALRASGLSYTIFRPGALLDDPATNDVMVGEGGTRLGGGSIPRADVATFMVAALYTPEARDRTFELVSRAGFRDGPGETVTLPWRFGPQDEGLRLVTM